MSGYRILTLGALAALAIVSLGCGAYFGTLTGVEVGRAIQVVLPPTQGTTDRAVAAAEYSGRVAFWTFLAICAQALLAGGALIALLREIRLTKQSSETQLRAYVSVQAHKLFTSSFSNSIRGELLITNGGQSPAYNLIHGSNFFVGDDESAEREILRSEAAHQSIGRPAPHTLQIGQTISGSAKSHRDLTAAEVEALSECSAKLFLFGFVEYTDAFENRRRSTFCFECDEVQMKFDYIGQKEIIEKPIIWTVSPFHNHST